MGWHNKPKQIFIRESHFKVRYESSFVEFTHPWIMAPWGWNYSCSAMMLRTTFVSFQTTNFSTSCRSNWWGYLKGPSQIKAIFFTFLWKVSLQDQILWIQYVYEWNAIGLRKVVLRTREEIKWAYYVSTQHPKVINMLGYLCNGH